MPVILYDSPLPIYHSPLSSSLHLCPFHTSLSTPFFYSVSLNLLQLHLSSAHLLLLPPPQLQLRCFRRKVRREISGLTLRSPALFSTPPSSSSSSSKFSRPGAFSSSPSESRPSSFAFSASLIASQRQEDAAVRVARHFLQVSTPGSRAALITYV